MSDMGLVSVAIIFLVLASFLSWLFFGQGSFPFALLAYQLNALLESSLEDEQVIITFGSWAIMIILIAMTGISILFFLRASTVVRR